MGAQAQRGFSLIEATVSILVLAIAMVGLAQTQVVGVRANRFARSMTVASGYARDLVENISLWDYADTRLAPAATVTSVDAAASLVAKTLDLGRAQSIGSGAIASFSDTASATTDSGVTNNNALGTYDGQRLTDSAGNPVLPGLARYWTTFAVDPDSDGIPDGKLVVVVVRWQEPGLGRRQLTETTFKANPGAVAP